MKTTSNYIWKLGMFVIVGITLFIATIYFVGATRNLFGSTIHLKSNFKNVAGLKVGNNVRFSGINIGTIKSISFISDTLVTVDFIIKDEVQKYIKTDARTSIGTDGLMGDKMLTISPGTPSNPVVKENAFIASERAIEMGDIMKSLKISMDYTGIVTKQLSEFSYKINNGKGTLAKVLTDEKFSKSIDKTLQNLESGSNEFMTFTKNMNDKNGTLSKLMTDPAYAYSIKKTLSTFEKSAADINVFTSKLKENKGLIPRLLSDEKMANSLDSTLINLQSGTKKLNTLEDAAANNFLLRGYFKKQQKAKEEAAKKQKIISK